ncbi:hypothetical protein [Kocuria palustris]|uniref:hypothetical protein n=1 Tax=Kocuria palustris TaxID=71999 RepID=UPI00119D170D|nr:hypothetical protein [Kocuria palustris]
MTPIASEAQPGTAPPELPEPGTRRGPALGHAALGIALVALVLSTLCAALVGVVLIEAQQLSDGTWTGMSPDARARAWVLLSSQVACGLLGLGGLVLGVIAFLRGQGRGAARSAIVVASLGPLVAWATWGVASEVAA